MRFANPPGRVGLDERAQQHAVRLGFLSEEDLIADESRTGWHRTAEADGAPHSRPLDGSGQPLSLPLTSCSRLGDHVRRLAGRMQRPRPESACITVRVLQRDQVTRGRMVYLPLPSHMSVSARSRNDTTTSRRAGKPSPAVPPELLRLVILQSARKRGRCVRRVLSCSLSARLLHDHQTLD